MKFLIGVFLVMNAVVISDVSMASGGSGQGIISYFYHRGTDGLLAIYKDGGDWSNPDGCNQSNAIILTRDTLSRSEFYSAILASKMAGRTFSAYLSGCVAWNGATYPKIHGIYTY